MSLTFTLYNTKTIVKGGDPTILRLIAKACTYQYEYYGMDWSKRPARRAKLMASICYFDRQNNHFPTGWASKVFRSLKINGVNFEWADQRKKPTKKFNIRGQGLFNLRPEYQIEALQLCLNTTRGIIHHGTGAGKSVIIHHLINELKLFSLIMVPDRNLLYQMYEGATKDDKGLIHFFGENNCGIIGDGISEISLINVATVPTLWEGIKRQNSLILKLLNRVDLLMVDEAHHISIAGKNKIKNSYYQVCQNIDSYYRFGFTATPGEPKSLERSLLEASTGRVIHRVSSSQLIEWGYLTRPEVRFYQINGMLRYSDWQTAYRINILENRVRNNKIKRLAQELTSRGMTVLIIVKRVEDHGKVLCEMIEGSVLMTGKTPMEERQEIFNDFSSKKIKTLISTVIKEGSNIPSMDAIIIAPGGKSDKALTQWVGRVLRRSSGKKRAIIIDFFDQDGGILEKHSEKRLTVYEEEEAYDIHIL